MKSVHVVKPLSLHYFRKGGRKMLTGANLELTSNEDGHREILQAEGTPATDLVGGWAADLQGLAKNT